ncbi:hypothetical protein PG995_005334 [Apiospora arundinis]
MRIKISRVHEVLQRPELEPAFNKILLGCSATTSRSSAKSASLPQTFEKPSPYNCSTRATVPFMTLFSVPRTPRRLWKLDKRREARAPVRIPGPGTTDHEAIAKAFLAESPTPRGSLVNWRLFLACYARPPKAAPEERTR